MSNPQTPDQYHPDLLEERLIALAQFFADTRTKVVALHEPLDGDDSWSLGCRGFARSRNLLLQKFQSGEWPWLGIINPGKKFIFSIGTVPVRFYRGSHKKPPSRSLANNAQELSQLSLAFATADEQHRYLKWRFAIETNFLGEPSAIIFAGMASNDDSEGSVVCHWKIPFDSEEMKLVPTTLRTDDMVELPAPSVKKPIVKKLASSNDE